jgi:hypothetical protein
MGTGSHDTDLKTEASRSYIMARLFRGLLDILRTRNDTLVKEVLAHIRGFDHPLDETEVPYQNVLGFWRMVVEIVFHIYAQISLGVGILIVSALVVLAWPLRFLVELFASSWVMRSSQYHYQPHPDDIPPMEEPKMDDKNSKVVRRVVYEETKVPKTK